MDDITWTSLATITGAGIVAGLVVEFVGVYADLTSVAKRRLSAAVALVCVLVAVVAISGWDWPTLALAVPTGLQAGLSASAAYDTIRHGAAYVVTRDVDMLDHG